MILDEPEIRSPRIKPASRHMQPGLAQQVHAVFSEQSHGVRTNIYSILAHIFAHDVVALPLDPKKYNYNPRDPAFTFLNVFEAYKVLFDAQCIAPTFSTNDLVEVRPAEYAYDLFDDIIVLPPQQRKGEVLIDRKPWRAVPLRTTRFSRQELELAEAHLNATNEFLAGIELGICPESGYRSLYNRPFGERRRSQAATFELMPSTIVLTRMYNSEGHGRFYQRAPNAYWTQPSALREHITLNGENVTEVDYSANHVNVLCAMTGKPNTHADPYTAIIDAIGADEEQRKEVKRLTIVAIATKNDAQFARFGRGERMQPYFESLREAGIDPLDVRRAFVQLYPHTAPYLGKRDLSHRIMYEESLVMETLLRQARERSIPVAPIHDCVVSPQGKADEVYGMMVDAFQARFPNAKAFIKQSGVTVLPFPTERPYRELARA